MDEVVDIVDENLNILYQTTKREAHEKGLLHKTVIAEIFDSAGNIMLVKPYFHKQDAGQFVSPVGGHVRAGERDELALVREVKEEVGLNVTGCRLKGSVIYHRNVLKRDENHFFIVYEVRTDEKPALGDEAEEYKWFTKEELKSGLRNNRKIFGDAFLYLVAHLYPELSP